LRAAFFYPLGIGIGIEFLAGSSDADSESDLHGALL
jgi:hypothetical protein